MITCHQYDYIEIACMYRYQVRLTFKSGDHTDGIALDTAKNEAKQECLKLQTDHGQILVELEELEVLTAITPNPHFTQVRFS